MIKATKKYKEKKFMHRSWITLSIVITLFSLLLGACAPTSTPTAAVEAPTAMAEVPTSGPIESTIPVPTGNDEFPEIDPADFSGEINIAGSSTVYPLTVAVAEQFKAEGFSGDINIASVGTGGGFERFCKTGETDISNASRAIKDSEVSNCAALNPPRTPVEFRVGTDAMAVVVSKENTFAEDITLEELAHLLTDAVNWSDVRPEWPNEPIQRFVPGTDSGTFDFMVETLQKPLGLETIDEVEAAVLAATNQQMSEDDNVLVQGVEGSPYAIAYFGFAYYKNEASRLKVLSINGIAPTFDSAESGEYPISRPLFIYSDAQIMKAKPQVAAFIAYYLASVNDLIEDVGYFPASQDAQMTARQAYLDAVK
jgi:phosphate transport system substrate-binding protein